MVAVGVAVAVVVVVAVVVAVAVAVAVAVVVVVVVGVVVVVVVGVGVYMKKLLITCPVYGATYTDIFLNIHLKSLLDETNIPALKGQVEYIIFTDVETEPTLRKHPNVLKLLSHCEVTFRDFTWRAGANKFGMRYSLLVNTLAQSLEVALAKDMYVMPIVADYCFAKEFLPMTMARFDAGHDSVFVMPMRVAAEGVDSMADYIAGADGALEAVELFEESYKRLHPIWVAAHWEAPQFTKEPFTLLWNSGKGLLARSYSITPVIFQPTQAMLDFTIKHKKVIDISIPGMCKNPYWAHDWLECPVVCVEPITCYWPPYSNDRRAGRWVGEWAGKLDRSQLKWVEHKLYYPSKEIVDSNDELASDLVVRMLSIAQEGREQASEPQGTA